MTRSLTLLVIVLLGAVVGGGVVLLVQGADAARGRAPVARPGSTLRASGCARSAAGCRSRSVVGAAGAAAHPLAGRWPSPPALLVLRWHALFGGAGAERRAIARLEALAAWTESLRDTIAGAVGLEQAIPATAYAASPAIAGELDTLVDRLRVRVPLPVALQRFADDLDDASADLIVAALILNSRLRGPGLRDVLSSLAGLGARRARHAPAGQRRPRAAPGAACRS